MLYDFETKKHYMEIKYRLKRAHNKFVLEEVARQEKKKE